MSKNDLVRVTTYVDVEPLDAFEVFTEETDLWWRQGPRFRFGARGKLEFKGRSLVETSANGREFEIGKVLVWEPGARLVFEWRARNFEPGQITHVEIRFEPQGEGTQVTLEHRGWSTIPDDHPARHGAVGAIFIGQIGRWWGDLVTAYRARAGER